MAICFSLAKQAHKYTKNSKTNSKCSVTNGAWLDEEKRFFNCSGIQFTVTQFAKYQRATKLTANLTALQLLGNVTREHAAYT